MTYFQVPNQGPSSSIHFMRSRIHPVFRCINKQRAMNEACNDTLHTVRPMWLHQSIAIATLVPLPPSSQGLYRETSLTPFRPIHDPVSACSGFHRVSLGPGQLEVVNMMLGGDNLANMLVKPGQNAPPSLTGSLEIQIGGVTTSALQNFVCLLTEPEQHGLSSP